MLTYTHIPHSAIPLHADGELASNADLRDRDRDTPTDPSSPSKGGAGGGGAGVGGEYVGGAGGGVWAEEGEGDVARAVSARMLTYADVC